jgi:hypothetical protein
MLEKSRKPKLAAELVDALHESGEYKRISKEVIRKRVSTGLSYMKRTGEVKGKKVDKRGRMEYSLK